MGDISANLSRSEFACRCKHEDCNGKKVVHMPLAISIQSAVNYFAAINNTRARVNITSGNRCPKHNYDVLIGEGYSHIRAMASLSRHKDFIAVDHNIEIWKSGKWVRIPAAELAAYYDDQNPKSCGIGIYKNGRVHFDMDMARARRWPRNESGAWNE